MKRLLAIFLMLLVLIITLATPILAAGPSLHTATGGGTVSWTVYESQDTYKCTYTFTVQQLDEAGNAKGNFVFTGGHGVVPSKKMEADLKYVYFEGNTVYMSGTITQSLHYRESYVGHDLLFAAKDNGEGNRASGLDQISQVTSFYWPGHTAAALDEYWRYYLHWYDLTNGNIQIK